MLTIFVKTVANTNNSTFVTILLTILHSATSFFHGHLLIKLIEWLLSRNGKITIVYSDMMLMSKHCSSIYFRCKTTVRAFTLSVTVMLLLTDLTRAPDDRSTGIEYCQKISEKYCRYPYRYRIRKVLPLLKKYRRHCW